MEEGVAAAYGALADRYTELFGSIHGVHPDDLALVDRHLRGVPGPVFDVGCGPGHLTEHLASSGASALGFDLVPAFLEVARARSAGWYLRADLCHLPVRDGAAAGILAWYSLIHLRPGELDAALRELRRVASLGCVLVAGFFDGDRVEAFDHAVTTAHRWPLDAFAERLADAGFAELERAHRPGDLDAGIRAHAVVVAVAR